MTSFQRCRDKQTFYTALLTEERNNSSPHTEEAVSIQSSQLCQTGGVVFHHAQMKTENKIALFRTPGGASQEKNGLKVIYCTLRAKLPQR